MVLFSVEMFFQLVIFPQWNVIIYVISGTLVLLLMWVSELLVVNTGVIWRLLGWLWLFWESLVFISLWIPSDKVKDWLQLKSLCKESSGLLVQIFMHALSWMLSDSWKSDRGVWMMWQLHPNMWESYRGETLFFIKISPAFTANLHPLIMHWWHVRRMLRWIPYIFLRSRTNSKLYDTTYEVLRLFSKSYESVTPICNYARPFTIML